MSFQKAVEAASLKETVAKRASRVVYRLEDSQGRGPFAGKQVCVPYLRPHADPQPLLRLFGYPDEVLNALSTAGFVFGWRTKKHYREFFKRAGQEACRKLGYEMVIYYPELRFDLPDGQVLFAKTVDDVNVTHSLKKLLRILPNMARR